MLKICTRCRIPQDTTAFAKCTSRPDGLQCWCKICHAQYQSPRANGTKARWRDKNREKYNTYMREYQRERARREREQA